jgi:hypothetical protein
VAVTVRRLTEATSDLVFLDLPRRGAKALLSQPRDGAGVIWPHLTQEQLAHHVAGTPARGSPPCGALRGGDGSWWTGRTVTVWQPEMLARLAGG